MAGMRLSTSVLSTGSTVSIGNVSDFKNELEAHFHEGKSLTIDASELVNVDLCFVQLIISASRSFESRDLRLKIISSSDVITKAFERCGVEQLPINQTLVA